MARKVKCKYCGQEFDREYNEYVKIGTRYAHKDCHMKAQKETEDLHKVTDLIKSLYYPQEPSWKVIGSQLHRYRDEGMTYAGIYYTLTYFFTIQHNDIHKGAGIGIVPYTYKKAQAYYKNINNIYTQTARFQQQEDLQVKQTEDIITVTHNKPTKKLLDFKY